MGGGKRLTQKKGGLLAILERLGFTNCLAVLLVLLLIMGLAGGFVLAVLSIKYQYTGADGEGIKYATAKATNFAPAQEPVGSVDSPAI